MKKVFQVFVLLTYSLSTPGAARDFKILKEFVDLAAKMGWEYSLVDAGWQNLNIKI